MRQLTIPGSPPPTSDPAFLEWVREALTQIQIASAENVFEPETLNVYAKIDSQAFTGTPTAPNPDPGDDSEQIATTAFVADAVATGVNGLAPLDDPDFTGTPTAPTPDGSSDDKSIANTEWVKDRIADSAYTPPAIAQGQLLARTTAGTGTAEAVALSALLDLVFGNSAGGLLARDAAVWAFVPPGTSGQVATSNVGAAPTFQDPPHRITSAMKSANTARNSSTTLTDDPDLTLAVAENTKYEVDALVFYTAGGGNIHLALTGPSGATGLVIPEQGIGTNVSAAVGLAATTGAIGSNSTIGTQAVAIRGYISIGANAGVATIQWNRNGGSGTTTALAGSRLRLTKVAT